MNAKASMLVAAPQQTCIFDIPQSWWMLQDAIGSAQGETELILFRQHFGGSTRRFRGEVS
jgi:hypothetical protein